MKKILIIHAIAVAIVFAGCSKTTEDVVPTPQKDAGTIKSMTARPFSGNFSGTVINGGSALCGTNWTSKYFEGGGTANHCGISSMTNDYCVLTYQQYNNPISNGYGELTSANGDKIFTEWTALYDFDAWPPVPYGPGNVVTIHNLTGIITGGTGRFEGATGTLTDGGGLQPYLSTGAPWETSLWFTGTIIY